MGQGGTVNLPLHGFRTFIPGKESGARPIISWKTWRIWVNIVAGMTPEDKIVALLQESQTLTPGKDSVRLCALYEEAAALVDRKQKPKKWAAFRYMYGQAVVCSVMEIK